MQQFAAQEIGERIKQARKEAGLTQEELADLVEVTARTIQAYEAGDIDAYRKLNKLAEVLRRDISWFLHGEDDAVTSDEDKLREILREELADVRKAVDQVLALLEQEHARALEASQTRSASTR